jgi:hypothetical protein
MKGPEQQAIWSMYTDYVMSNRIELRWYLSSDDAFSAGTARAHCLRICAHILRHSVSSSRGPIIRKLQFLSVATSLLTLRTEGDSSDRIRMITTAFAGFTSVASAIQSNQREDVRSVAILLYSGEKRYISSTINLTQHQSYSRTNRQRSTS